MTSLLFFALEILPSKLQHLGYFVHSHTGLRSGQLLLNVKTPNSVLQAQLQPDELVWPEPGRFSQLQNWKSACNWPNRVHKPWLGLPSVRLGIGCESLPPLLAARNGNYPRTVSPSGAERPTRGTPRVQWRFPLPSTLEAHGHMLSLYTHICHPVKAAAKSILLPLKDMLQLTRQQFVFCWFYFTGGDS